MKFIVATLFLFSFINLSAQTESTNLKNDSAKIIPAKFPSGEKGWKNFVEKNINSGLIVSCGCVKIPFGKTSTRVIAKVKFLVDTSGNILNAYVENGKEIDNVFVEEALRIINKSPKWIPAEKENKKVTFENNINISWFMKEQMQVMCFLVPAEFICGVTARHEFLQKDNTLDEALDSVAKQNQNDVGGISITISNIVIVIPKEG